MVLIKRYPNRKLYDTEARRYVTLEGVCERICANQEIQVVDHSSGEDITTLTLSQIIVEQEKRRDGFLPNSFLAGLIRSNGEWLSAIQHGLRSPFIFQRQLDDEIGARLQEQVQAGELSEDEAGEMLEKILSRPPASEAHPLDLQIKNFLTRSQIPTRQDIRILDRKIDDLAERLEALLGSDS